MNNGTPIVHIILTMARRAYARLPLTLNNNNPVMVEIDHRHRATAATYLGITAEHMRDIERGTVLPTDEQARSLAAVYGMDADRFAAQVAKAAHAKSVHARQKRRAVARLARVITAARKRQAGIEEARWTVQFLTAQGGAGC